MRASAWCVSVCFSSRTSQGSNAHSSDLPRLAYLQTWHACVREHMRIRIQDIAHLPSLNDGGKLVRCAVGFAQHADTQIELLRPVTSSRANMHIVHLLSMQHDDLCAQLSSMLKQPCSCNFAPPAVARKAHVLEDGQGIVCYLVSALKRPEIDSRGSGGTCTGQTSHDTATPKASDVMYEERSAQWAWRSDGPLRGRNGMSTERDASCSRTRSWTTLTRPRREQSNHRHRRRHMTNRDTHSTTGEVGETSGTSAKYDVMTLNLFPLRPPLVPRSSHL